MRAITGFLSRLFRSRKLAVALVGSAVIAGMLAGYVWQPRLIRMLDHKLYDALLLHYGKKDASPLPVIIDLDEASLTEYGQWPWPRFLITGLLQKLAEQGVAAVGVDVLLAEADRTSPRYVQEDLRRFLNLDVTISGLPAALYDYDRLLAEGLHGLPVVLGMSADFNGATRRPVKAPNSVGYVLQKTPDAAPFSDELVLFPEPFWVVSSLG